MYKKTITTLAFVLAMVAVAACSTPPVQHGTIDANKDHVVVTVVFNPEIYPHFFGVKYPQMAVWAKAEGGDEIKTIYVTEKGSKNNWVSADARPSSVPVWYGVHKSETQKLEVDAVSGATPGGNQFTIQWQIPYEWANKKIEISLEGNVSFDYNDTYLKDVPEDNAGFSGVNGQPSLIWRATLDSGTQNDAPVPLKIVGHGSLGGQDHKIDPNLDDITTAKEMFLHLDARFVAGGTH